MKYQVIYKDKYGDVRSQAVEADNKVHAMDIFNDLAPLAFGFAPKVVKVEEDTNA